MFFFVQTNCSDNISTVENVIDPSESYSLIWNDEFDGNILDDSKWSHSLPGERRDAINVRDAVKLDGNGHLIISTYKSEDNVFRGMIGTQDKFESKYGYWECRMKLQTQIGQWSAFWLQSPLFGSVPGDTHISGTEIDIFEYVTKFKNIIVHSIHWDGYEENHKFLRSVNRIDKPNEGFHTFGLEWTENEYIFYIDRVETWRTNKAISHTNQYIILSLEVEGWAGNIRNAVLPDSICIDYVRMYK